MQRRSESVVIMEPLQGSRLVNALPPKKAKLFRKIYQAGKLRMRKSEECRTDSGCRKCGECRTDGGCGKCGERRTDGGCGKCGERRTDGGCGKYEERRKIASCAKGTGGKGAGCACTHLQVGTALALRPAKISVILSGMNSMEMLDENIRIADEARVHSFTGADFAVIEKSKSRHQRENEGRLHGLRLLYALSARRRYSRLLPLL